MLRHLARISFNRIHTSVSILQIGTREGLVSKNRAPKIARAIPIVDAIRTTRLIGSPGRVIKLARSVHLIPLCARVHSIWLTGQQFAPIIG